VVHQFAREGFSGSILVAQGDRVALARGYGLADRERKIAADEHTRYSVAGFTKMFTAAAILTLEDEGLLKVSDPIGKFFPQVRGPAGEVTLHHLLTHTDGLTRHQAPIYRRERSEFIRAMVETPDSFPPGTGYRYNDFGHSLLGAVVEEVTGQPYESFIRERFLSPARMTETGFEPDGALMAREYAGRETAQYAIPQRSYVWGRRGSLGMVSTVGDMHRWLRAMHDPGVLSRRVRDRMMRTYGRSDWGADQGYGWDLHRQSDGSGLWRRVAGTPGMEGEILFDPVNNWHAVILVNSRIGWRFHIWREIAATLASSSK
jgi:CubicO group peptidase (beta-lactamase class C family)